MKLNPILWNEDGNLKPEINKKIIDIVNEFIKGLRESEIPFNLLDIYIVGSNASYNYTDKSDLDVHIISNLSQLSCDPKVLQILFNYYKTYFNSSYDIKIKGIKVELYVEDVMTSSVSNGVYSVLNSEWVKKPQEVKPQHKDISNLYSKIYAEYLDVQSGIKNPEELLNELYLMRKSSIISEGEYGTGNLVFKKFRNEGHLDDLKQLIKNEKSKELSMESKKVNEAYNADEMKELFKLSKEIGINTVGDLARFSKEYQGVDLLKALRDYRAELGADFSLKEESASVSLSKLRQELDTAVKDFFKSKGFDENPDEFGLSIDDLMYVLDIKKDDSKNYLIVEVRAEASYRTMTDLAEVLDKVVQKYDEDSYFDAEAPGIINAVIWYKGTLKEDISESDYDKYEVDSRQIVLYTRLGAFYLLSLDNDDQVLVSIVKSDRQTKLEYCRVYNEIKKDSDNIIDYGQGKLVAFRMSDDESKKESYSDYVFIVKCNDGPKERVQVVAENPEQAEIYAKSMYSSNHTTNADDRNNKWTINRVESINESKMGDLVIDIAEAGGLKNYLDKMQLEIDDIVNFVKNNELSKEDKIEIKSKLDTIKSKMAIASQNL